ncbi:mannose-6-phosphate isomerase, class I [Falseniella ignava CCUG 37419]|uniref:Mannose-6-phosphate isomerase n=1 Tax=Falseniella ignava CCUG 37419 TaxID=883112 RepID=K1LLU2_9LACT|nr:mannose-6-phosphate isomerase, class I [Falseniella ignava]EKB55616.1 mannose-6-phosphate isomerase, class I [Falseniella ignava CCUG 37419]
MEPLFLEGVLQDKIWGGTKLRDEFGYDIPTETTGELWAISAHPNGPATIKNGEYAGKTLAELWKTNRGLFGNQEGETFPLLTKIIDAHNDLSVQVHPDDAYGLAHEGELGKTECWYVLSAEPGAKIVFGHNATSEEEFKLFIENDKWEDLLRSVKVEAGDFFYVPSGTVHAIGSGVMILETQQSSDTTYRLYDYERRDDSGNLRELHIKESIDVTTIPHSDEQPKFVINKQENGFLKTLISNEFFTVYEWDLWGEVSFDQKGLYTLISVIDGQGELLLSDSKFKIKKGDHFILPNNIEHWKFLGDLKIIASHP